MSIMLMGLFFAVIIALAQVSRSNLRQADNHENGFQAQLAAEGGMSYITYLLKQCEIPAGSSPSELMDSISDQLGDTINNSSAIGGGSVTSSGTRVTIPTMVASSTSGGNFSATLLPMNGHNMVFLQVRGNFGQTSRTVGMGFKLQPGGSKVFAYGIATNGTIYINGSSIIKGVNSPSEANILSQAMDEELVLRMNGSGSIQGDMYMTNPLGRVWMNGWCSIGGANAYSGDLEDHIHTGVEVGDLPEVDPTPLLNAVTLTDVDNNTDTNGQNTFSNIRVKAGTNIKFNGQTTLEGVIYLESPNKVTFGGGINVTGVIIGEKGPGNNEILFNGGVQLKGVEDLPDEPEYHELRKMPGSSVLAPTFDVRFNGSSRIGGCIAVKSFRLNGACDNTMKGGIICYGTDTLRLNGSHIFRFDRSESPETPAGFSGPTTLVPDANTYYDYSSSAQ